MINITDTITGQTATIAVDDFVKVVSAWYEDAPAEIVDAIAEVGDQLAAGTFIAGSAIGSLGLDITPA